MKTREELEKMFDEKFEIHKMPNRYNRDIKQFIFETIIQEVLNNFIINTDDNISIELYYNDLFNEKFKQKAKELYNITL